MRVCATKDKVQLGQLALEAAEQIVSFYNKWYDIKYPFGKIDLLAAPDRAAAHRFLATGEAADFARLAKRFLPEVQAVSGITTLTGVRP